jgi:hypothetical protein
MDSTVSATNGDLMSRTARQLAPATTLVALMLGAGPAMAAPPLPVPVPPFILLPTGLGCPDFNLGIEATGGNLHTKIFVDENGEPVRRLTAGKGVLLTYTNFGPDPAVPIAGQSIKIKTGGSVLSERINPDGTMTFTATGHNGLVLFPSDVPAGPSTTQYIGRIVYHVDPMTGVFTLLQESNNQRDVCAELSD